MTDTDTSTPPSGGPTGPVGPSPSMARRVYFSPATKFFLIGFLTMILMVPLFVVWGLNGERQSRANRAQTEVAQSWGGSQTIRGPALIVPVTVQEAYEADGQQRVRERRRFAVFLPETLSFDAATKSKILKRSIFETTVFSADLTITGRFGDIALQQFSDAILKADWANAVVALNLTSLSSLKDSVQLVVDGAGTAPFEPSLGLAGAALNSSFYNNGIHAKPFANQPGGDGGVTSRPGFGFSIKLAFTGSRQLFFSAAGRSTDVTVKSDWPHPSFAGAFLPDKRTIDKTGFSASWHVPHLARSVPQVFWAGSAVFQGLAKADFGVRYFVPVDHYNLVDRALKYGLLFIAVAFGAVFVLELLSTKRINPVQYFLVGLAMILFYLILLSLSEHVGFKWAYVTAAAATGIMLSIYVGMALASRLRGLIMMIVFILLYGLLYLLLRLEDYALLAGSLAGFVLLTAGMFGTLRVDWSGLGRLADTVRADLGRSAEEKP